MWKGIASGRAKRNSDRAIRDGIVRRYHGTAWFAEAASKGVITEAAAEQLKEVEGLVARVIAVDHFDPLELKPNYVDLGHNARGSQKLAAE